jgi:hypothetical protein
MTYMLLDPEAKSTSERCIRVAAIAIVTIAGIWNPCNTKGVKKNRAPYQ